MQHNRASDYGLVSVRNLLPETARGGEGFRIELVVERVDRDGLAGTRRVHETALAYVYANVIHAAAVDVEEHEIAGLELARLDLVGLLRLLARSTRHFEAELAVRVEHQAAAIETIARRAAVAVARAAQRQREFRQRLAAVAHRGRAAAAVPGRRCGLCFRSSLARCWRRVTGDEQQRDEWNEIFIPRPVHRQPPSPDDALRGSR